ncbi:MAG: hypothetical protein M3041_07035 [Acidobacteriota bacterium]|nr:hypothetical protein [Acidobacteriota bacterium]
MTVCIAVISGQHIITVSDMMLSNAEASVESAVVKSRILDPAGRWFYMYSTDDLTHAFEIYNRAKAALIGQNPHGDLNLKPKKQQVVDAVRSAYHDYIRDRADNYLKPRYDWTRQQLIDQGLAKLGPETFSRILYEVEQIDAGVDLLVAGHDQANTPHIFSVKRHGEVEDHDAIQFHAIGAGAWAALGSLFANAPEIHTTENVAVAVYRACEAKFISEMARSVGSKTVMMAFSGDGRICPVPGMSAIRNLWKSRGRPRVPKKAVEMLTEVLKDFTFDLTPQSSTGEQQTKGPAS